MPKSGMSRLLFRDEKCTYCRNNGNHEGSRLRVSGFSDTVTFRGLSRMYEAIQLPDESTSTKTLTADSQDFVVGEMIRVRLVQQ